MHKRQAGAVPAVLGLAGSTASAAAAGAAPLAAGAPDDGSAPVGLL